MNDTIAALNEAKRNVTWLLDHPNGLVDFRGLVHWAGRVEMLREEIKGAL